MGLAAAFPQRRTRAAAARPVARLAALAAAGLVIGLGSAGPVRADDGWRGHSGQIHSRHDRHHHWSGHQPHWFHGSGPRRVIIVVPGRPYHAVPQGWPPRVVYGYPPVYGYGAYRRSGAGIWWGW